jgi:hypothetical protein
MAPSLTHRSPLAGSWYPSDPSDLTRLLESAIESSGNRTGPFLRRGGLGYIVPHAAPIYSGKVAASVYRHIRESGMCRVVLLGFSHRRALECIALPQVDRIATPLGEIPVNREALERLAARPPFRMVAEHQACDHSVEIQIPFLQLLVPGAELVPLYVGRLTGDERRAAAEALRGLLDPRTTLIASSDLTHYGRDFGFFPFAVDDSTQDNLHALDMGVLDAAGSLDPALFQRELRTSGATVCGTEPIQLLLETLAGVDGEVFQEILDYETSGEICHDFTRSVSYGATGFFPAPAFELDAEDQAAMLASARFSLDQYRSLGHQKFMPQPHKSSLLQRGRSFVTLYGPHSIRGCVGCFESPLALADSVPRLAIAANQDTRFGRAEAGEPLKIEVHVLTPPRRVSGAAQIKVGQHGAFLRAKGRKGLLLASVATRFGLTTRQFMTELARKAGVSDDVYSAGGWQLSVFCDQSFEEN